MNQKTLQSTKSITQPFTKLSKQKSTSKGTSHNWAAAKTEGPPNNIDALKSPPATTQSSSAPDKPS